MEIVEEAHYVMSNITNNNNKFWRIFRYSDHSCKVEFGRVGDSGQSKNHTHVTESVAKSFFNKKCSEKAGKGYKKIDIITESFTVKPSGVLSEVASKQIDTTSSEVSKLIDKFAKANVHNILSSTTMKYDIDSGLFKTPVGIVTESIIVEARKVLNDMLPYVTNKDLTNPSYCKLLENYLMYIPQNVGRKLDPNTLYKSPEDLNKQSDILDSLEVSINTVRTSPKKDGEVVEAPKIFNVSVNILEDAVEFNRINDFFKNNAKTMHQSSRYSLKKIYIINIENMKKSFEEVGSKVGNIQELWHGTKVSNILSILKSGLVMPNPNSGNFTGAMFGLGLYFSDQSTKSLNYSSGYWGGGTDNNPYMFIADVAMGKSYTPDRSSSNLPKPGYDSTYAIGGKSGVMNNEMIVYKTNQCNLKYLCEFA